MKTVTVNAKSSSYDILIGSDILKEIPLYLQTFDQINKISIVTDDVISKFHLANLCQILKTNNLQTNVLTVKAGEKSKSWSNLKKVTEWLIENKVEKDIRKKAETSTKLRFLKTINFKKQEYLRVGNARQCSKIMMIRLNMTDLKANYKNQNKDVKCIGCEVEVENTEHVFRCTRYKELARHSLQISNDCKELEDTAFLLEAIKVMDRIAEVREVLTINKLIEV